MEGELGGYYWGLFGAAGLLLRTTRGDGVAVLLQHRAPWSHQGGTWALPGGARDEDESAVDAALREADEEAGLLPGQLTVRGAVLTAKVSAKHSDEPWKYTIVVADTDSELDTVPNRESSELQWVGEDEVDSLNLHPGFKDSWPQLRAVIENHAVLHNPDEGDVRQVTESGELFKWCPAEPGPREDPAPPRPDLPPR